jgi:5-methylcytosine-specific restriction endonuclease McrA
MIRLSEISIQYVFEMLCPESTSKSRITISGKNGKQYQVRKNSHRYILFKTKGLTCVCCGDVANKAFIEISENDLICGLYPHINFYKVSPGHLDKLFTKDHIIPKSKGGKDVQENYQTMCRDCNNLKGSN